jgi:hypothetical protein
MNSAIQYFTYVSKKIYRETYEEGSSSGQGYIRNFSKTSQMFLFTSLLNTTINMVIS